MKNCFKIGAFLLMLLFAGCSIEEDFTPDSMFDYMGGKNDDGGVELVACSDGGYLVVAVTKSFNRQMEESDNEDEENIWVLKFSKDKKLQWQKSIGGGEEEFPVTAIETQDGNFVILANTQSSDGDVQNYHTSTYFDWNTEDIWVVKLSKDGDVLTSRCLGGSESDIGYSITTTPDGGFLVAGRTISENGDVKGLHIIGNTIWEDAWIVKLKSNLEIQWQRCLGGDGNEIGYFAYQNTDTSIVVLAVTESLNGDVQATSLGPLGRALWRVVLDAQGEKILSQKIYTQLACNVVLATRLATNGNLAMCGHIEPSYEFWNNNLHYFGMSYEMFPNPVLFSLDKNGTLLWQNRTLPPEDLGLIRMVKASDGSGYVGVANHYEVSDNKEIWVFKLDNSGNMINEMYLGGNDTERVFSILPIGGSKYLITGYTSVNYSLVDNSYDVYVHTITMP